MDQNQKNQKILIVEDSLTIRNKIKRTLEREGYLTELAENGKVSLKKLGIHHNSDSKIQNPKSTLILF